MAKKLTGMSPESSLSPVADDLIEQVETATAVKPEPRGTKRKATRTSAKRTKTTISTEIKDEEVSFDDDEEATPRSRRGKPAPKKVKHEEESEQDEFEVEDGAGIEDKAKSKAKAKVQVPKTKTTSRKKKQVALTPLEERTLTTKLLMGAHVSTSGGVHNAVVNIVYIGGNAFALFLKNNHKWQNADLSSEFAELFIAGCKEHGFDVAKCCVPHGSYLVNLAHPDPERKKQAYDSFLNDLTRCHTLGIKLYNFHPGNANATTREDGIRTIAANINQAHNDPSSGEVVTVLETMATQGNTIGGSFADLAQIIRLVNNKDRVGVCLDTCHVFAAGYDLRTPEAYAATMAEFDKVIGLKYLKALHINDSKAPLFSNRDLHARIGTGYLGLRAFHNVVNDKRLHGLPMVLETPIDVVNANGKKTEDKGIWAREIKMLENLVGMDVNSKEFVELEAKLQDEGADERTRVGEQVERKKAKDAKPKKKSKKKATVETEDKEDDDDE